MLIFWKAGLVLLAVPKTGTTALAAALDGRADIAFRNPPGAKHIRLYRFQKFVRPMLDRGAVTKWQTVAVMREPLDWLGSWYRYRSRPALDGHENSTSDMSFADFVARHLDAPNAAPSNVGRQSRFFEPAPGEAGINHLFAYERMPQLVNFLERRLQCRIAMPRRNVSPKTALELPKELQTRLVHSREADMMLHTEILQNGGYLKRSGT